MLHNYQHETKGLEPLPAELVEKGELPLVVILAISGACFLLLLVNAGLICWYVIKRKAKGKFFHFIFILWGNYREGISFIQTQTFN